MSTIKATNTRDLRKNFKKYADDISAYDETLIITRPNNKNVVMISEAEFNSWQETNHLLRSKANVEALRQSLSELDEENDSKVLTPKQWKKLSDDE